MTSAFRPSFTITNRLTAGLTRIERARGFLKAAAAFGRQGAALGYILEHGSLTIHDLVRLFPGVNRRSLQRDLRTLVDRELIAERATSPRDPTKRYVAAEGVGG